MKTQNIKSGYMTSIISWGKKKKDEKGEYLVRFYDDMLGKYTYVTDGTKVCWLEEGYMGKNRKKYAAITAKNSEKYYIEDKMYRNTSPQGNGDIDHFLELENGYLLATTIAGYGYYKITQEIYETECWGDFWF